ncbi:glucuronide permease [Haemophilus influenzae 22.4-21]|uniref:Glucuronide permease n=2 Tax=Haemophilus influenzae TaxID=727 RepID=A4P178_HAEIF|nr:glucuronide permease [Haemophilus influenzae 22.4-21]
MAIAFISLLGLNYFMVIIWAFITDIIDYQFLKTHRREDGTIYAVYSFARKIGQALAGGLGGVALSLVGYMPNVPSQSSETLNSIYNVATLVPAISCIAIFVILTFWYPLSKEVVDNNSRELEKINK